MSTPLWNKRLKCPFCKFEFETTRLRSSAVRIKETESDFGHLYEGECAYFYSVTACPQCNFAALNKDFESVRPEYEPKIMEASQKIRATGRKRADIFGLGSSNPETAVRRHELAIAFARIRVYQDLKNLAVLYLHLVWLFRLMGDRDRERAAMAEAAKAYEEYHQKGSDMPEHLGEPGVLYLIGELNRRQGLFKEARRYYERALASKEIKSFPRIAELIRDMMLVAREEMG
ncbi:MAG TPA: DUF2225 domain-containing protein [bacterium]|nr:DUF2225 domain-containing protein [bacterium]